VHGPFSRYAGRVFVLYVLLAAIAVVAVDLRPVLIPTAIISLAFVATGRIVFLPMRAQVRFPWPAVANAAKEPGVIIVNGEAFPRLGYEQQLLVEMSTRGLTQLLSCSILALAALYVMLSGHYKNATPMDIGAFQAEIICISGATVLRTCLRWFEERKFLRVARFTFGSILRRNSGFVRSDTTYQFLDQNGERRGGSGPLPNDSKDNLVLVLYRPNDPDANAIQGSFAFHHFRVGLLPGRRMTAVGAGAER